MTVDNFRFKDIPHPIESFKSSWRVPSNIALVKYWGKKKQQIPENSSISFSLSNSYTLATITFKTQPSFDFDFLFEGKKKKEFEPKIHSFFERVAPYVPFINKYRLLIESKNSFPHSSGIASSASSMSALALCLVELERKINPTMSMDFFYRKSSFLARLGSGSASRSVYPNFSLWGQHSDFSQSSCLYSIPILENDLNPIFKNLMDTILIIDKNSKSVSSSKGHDLMNNHIFKKKRYQQANSNISRLRSVLSNGDLNEFIKIVEQEALSLHALMMTAEEPFILIQPNTLEVINKIWAFRKSTSLPLCFTLDAGANVHVIYPKSITEDILPFIKQELSPFCCEGQYINDFMGTGPKNILVN